MNAIKHMGEDAVLIGLYELGIRIENIGEIRKKHISDEAQKLADRQLGKLEKRK